MRIRRIAVCFVVVLLSTFASYAEEPKAAPEWSMNATIIEACSCPMFCQCYFNTEPAGHTMTMNMPEHHMEHGMSSQAHY